jgi:putative hydrolase of HD superfamily
MRTNDTLLDLLLETQALDRVPRFGYLIRGVDNAESVTEHSWHVLFLVWILADHLPEVDRGRALDIAMVHDLAELRLGDLARTASRYFPPGSKQQAESAAMAEILAPLPAKTRHLLDEYHDGQTREALLVKACDKLQLMIKVAVYESWGATGMTRFWDNPENFFDGGFDLVRALYEELRARRESADLNLA